MKNRWNWLVILVILAAFTLRVYRLDLQDIWWDEARNIDVAGRALAQIAAAPELDIHPPVYFYLLHGWLAAAGPNTDQLPGQGAFAARFMSLWFGVLLVPLMAALGRRVGGLVGRVSAQPWARRFCLSCWVRRRRRACTRSRWCGWRVRGWRC